MVIACSDSRVDPSQIFDVSPGEIFVVRNVANLVPPFEVGGEWHGVSAALEFAVTQLNIPEIVVLGHGSCGGVHASLTRRFEGRLQGEGGFIDSWIHLLSDARDRIVHEHGEGPEGIHALELETVRVSLNNLMTFPFIAERVLDDRLKLHGAYFSIAHGMLLKLDDKGAFHPALQNF